MSKSRKKMVSIVAHEEHILKARLSLIQMETNLSLENWRKAKLQFSSKYRHLLGQFRHSKGEKKRNNQMIDAGLQLKVPISGIALPLIVSYKSSETTHSRTSYSKSWERKRDERLDITTEHVTGRVSLPQINKTPRKCLYGPQNVERRISRIPHIAIVPHVADDDTDDELENTKSRKTKTKVVVPEKPSVPIEVEAKMLKECRYLRIPSRHMINSPNLTLYSRQGTPTNILREQQRRV